jgi:hypothetical protein
MFEKTIETSMTPHITIEECLGNLTVRGRTETEITVVVQESDDEVAWKREGETLTVSLPASGTVTCPPGTTLTIKRVLGNLRVEQVKGTLAIGAVYGNTTLGEVGPVALEEALANLSVRGVAGRLESQGVKGNARIRDVEATLILGEVTGNLGAEGLSGGLTVEKVRGNVRLGPPFSPDAVYRLSAYGNLSALVPPEASLRVVLRAGGRVRSHVPGLVVETEAGESRGALGTGDALLEADVRGNASLRPSEGGEAFAETAGWDEVGAHLEWQVNDALARMATHLEESLGRWDSEWISRRVDQATEQARRRAEQAAERARMRAEQAERRWQRASGQRTAPQKQKASDEERLRVLRMLEEGKITLEQASELIVALEGR